MVAQYSPKKSAVKVSIVVLVYNDAEYLPACLDSLVNQSLKEIEILLVNDGSTDASPAIMNEYAARDRRIRGISFRERRSAFTAITEGIRKSSGAYIMFVDGGDYLAPNACERVWELEQESPVDILHFGINPIPRGERPDEGWKDNQEAGFLYGRDIFLAFQGKRRRKLHVRGNAFSRGILRNALSKCETLTLGKAEDRSFSWVTRYLAQSYRGCPSEILYNYRYGPEDDDSEKQVDLELFEQYCTMEWTCSAMEQFDRQRSGGDHGEFVREMRLLEICHCVELWGDMTPHDQPAALRLLLRYWSKPGDLGKIVGAFSRVFVNRLGELSDLLVSAFRDAELPEPKRPIRTVGTYFYRFSEGGTERSISLTLPVWSRLGYRVVFLTDEENENEYKLQEEVIRINCAFSRHDAVTDYTKRGEAWENLLRTYEVDVMVYQYCYGLCQLWDTLLCRLMGIPVMVFYHGGFDWMMEMSAALLIPGTARLGGGVITLNEMDRTFWRCAAPDAKVFQVTHPPTFAPAAVEPSDLDGRPAIVWTGRLSVEKQYLDTLEIMAEVVKRVPEAKLYLVGDAAGDSELVTLNSRMAELGLEESVIPCGFQMDVASWYRKASVFLLTSSAESFCFSLAEALTFGLPVVMYDLPYLTLVQGNGGIVSVPQRDTAAAADAICGLLKNRRRRREVGRRGRKFIEKLYSGDNIAKQWRHIFDSLGAPDAASKEPEIYREIFQLLLQQYKARLPPSGQNGEAGRAPLRFLYGDAAKQQYAELRSSGSRDNLVVSLVATRQDGQKLFNILLAGDGSRNWVTPEELKKALLECSDRNLVRFLYGDAAKQQYAELRAGGLKEKLEVSLVSRQDGKKLFNVLLASDGSRNWVTPEELKKALLERSDRNLVRFLYGDKKKQQYAELRANGPPNNLEVSLVTQQDGQKRFNMLLKSDGSRNWVTPEELKQALPEGSDGNLVRFPYGDKKKQQYAELRADGSQDNLTVSLVTRQDGQERSNILLNGDGSRNWATSDELKRLSERSEASKTALEAKIAELTGQLERLQALYDSLSEQRKARSKRT